jgi:hypothetical protein
MSFRERNKDMTMGTGMWRHGLTRGCRNIAGGAGVAVFATPLDLPF